MFQLKNIQNLLKHTDLFFCSMLHGQNLFYIHILYTQKGVYSIFEYKTNFERDAFRFSMSETIKNIIFIKSSTDL
jgi:hypothetical protein